MQIQTEQKLIIPLNELKQILEEKYNVQLQNDKCKALAIRWTVDELVWDIKTGDTSSETLNP